MCFIIGIYCSLSMSVTGYDNLLIISFHLLIKNFLLLPRIETGVEKVKEVVFLIYFLV